MDPRPPSSAAEHALKRFGLLNKKCLVTGGTKGIGAAIVEELCGLGAQVVTHEGPRLPAHGTWFHVG